MSANDNLPVILVSAVDAAAASVIISEIIDDGSPPVQCNGAEHSDDGEPEPGAGADAAGGAVWRLRNKYYTATARLLPLVDGAAPSAGLDVQAHVIYLTEDECADAAAWTRRAEGARAAAAGAGVRLVAARAAREPAALAQWARARRYEPVALLAPAPAPDEDEDVAETRGAARLREALHAHAWPGMRRAGAAHPARLTRDEDSGGSASSSDSEWGSWQEAGCERRASQFAEALALLPARRPARARDDDAARRLHAEQLVVAFCRALGHELRLDTPGTGTGQ